MFSLQGENLVPASHSLFCGYDGIALNKILEITLDVEARSTVRHSATLSQSLIQQVEFVEDNITYWSKNLEQKSQLNSLLFGRGPLILFKSILQILLDPRRAKNFTEGRLKLSCQEKINILTSKQYKMCELLCIVHESTADMLQTRSLLPDTLPSGRTYVNAKKPLSNATNELDKTQSIKRKIHSCEEKLIKVERELNNLRTMSYNPSDICLYSKLPLAMRQLCERVYSTLTDYCANSYLRSIATPFLCLRDIITEKLGKTTIISPDLKKPNWYQRRWVPYTVFGFGAMCLGCKLARHSRLCGSNDLEMWFLDTTKNIWEIYDKHVLDPLLVLRNEFFFTFREKPNINTKDDFLDDKLSLVRMLQSFREDFGSVDDVEDDTKFTEETLQSELTMLSNSTNDMVSLRKDFKFLMSKYEDELKSPLKNAVTGQLLRILLIQVQKMKVDSEAVMLQLDQILKANELNFALVAAIPSFLILGMTLVAILKWLQPKQKDPGLEAESCRCEDVRLGKIMAFVDYQRELRNVVEVESEALKGRLIYKLAILYRETSKLSARKIVLNAAEWDNLRIDLMQLSSAIPVGDKKRIAHQMSLDYAIFKTS